MIHGVSVKTPCFTYGWETLLSGLPVEILSSEIQSSVAFFGELDIQRAKICHQEKARRVP